MTLKNIICKILFKINNNFLNGFKLGNLYDNSELKKDYVQLLNKKL